MNTLAAFFKANIDWLIAALPKEMTPRQRKARANQIVGTLQGAMVLASSLRDQSIFDDAVAQLNG